eukprot:Gb_15954 [translate_table: standard]
MQHLSLENSDKIEQMEDRSVILALPSCSASCNDSVDIPQMLPRIGDFYQVEVPPFTSQTGCNGQDKGDSRGCEKSQDEDYEVLFAEGLPVPIMHIPCFSPALSGKNPDIDQLNGPSLENALETKELPISVVKMECGLYQQDSVELADKKGVHEHNFSSSIQFTQDSTDFSMVGTKQEFSRTEGEKEGASIDSVVAVDNVPDTLLSGRGQRRRKGKGGWKRVKKAKVDLLKPGKQKPDLNGHTGHSGLSTMGEDASSRSFIIVPDSPSELWTEAEEDVFILGLYIFGKNFVAVKSFMETKRMKDILSYYYGKFYKTDSYCRWAESRKIRSRKCFQGQRIFSGWRQQELSMRLLPHVPEPLKDRVPEAMKGFNEGRISIKEFVMELKALAGLKMLVQAVGIGKGSHDLTAALMDPVKINQVVATRCEIPMGRACSSLSTEEIVKFLTGDYRLSKARANDLFWEAVWPRLLARGWHSEQPEDQASFGFRHSLVFLVPGVQKFSRRILVKGIHYFDSVSEVLSRVASEPRLLDPPPQITGNGVKPECLWTAEIIEEQNHLQDPPCYLRPKYRTHELESFVFTVVDTSLVSQGEEPARFRQNKTLPADDTLECLQSDSGETEDLEKSELLPNKKVKTGKTLLVGDSLNSDADGVACIENLGRFDSISGLCTASPSPNTFHQSLQSEQKSCGSGGLMLQIGSSPSISEVCTVYSPLSSKGGTWEFDQQGCSYSVLDQNSQVVNNEASRRETPVRRDYLSSPSKHRRLNICNYDEGETRDGRFKESSETKEHRVSSSPLVKLDAKEETPVSLLETSISESGICIPSSIQAGQDKSETDLSTLLSGSGSSFNRINKNAVYSRLCRSKPDTMLNLTIHQDTSESATPNSIPVTGTALPGAPEQFSWLLQEQRADSGRALPISPGPNSESPKSEENSQSEQAFGHLQEQPNGAGQPQPVSSGPLAETAKSEENSHSQQDSGHNDSGQVQSAGHSPDGCQPHEPLESNVQEFPAEARRQSTRTRPLTTRALEAFASGFFSIRRRRAGRSSNPDSSYSRSIPRQVPDDPACFFKCCSPDNNDITIVDTSMESVEGERNSHVQLSGKSRRGYKRRRRTHAVMKVPKAVSDPENLGQEKREDVVTEIKTEAQLPFERILLRHTCKVHLSRAKEGMDSATKRTLTAWGFATCLISQFLQCDHIINSLKWNHVLIKLIILALLF